MKFWLTDGASAVRIRTATGHYVAWIHPMPFGELRLQTTYEPIPADVADEVLAKIHTLGEDFAGWETFAQMEAACEPDRDELERQQEIDDARDRGVPSGMEPQECAA